MKGLLVALIVIHGVIHLLGFVKAFDLAAVNQLALPISRTAGIFWLLTCILLAVSAVLLLIGSPWWWIPACAGVIISQALILGSWSDAKFGTIANLLLVLPMLSGLMNSLPSSYVNRFHEDARQRLTTVKQQPLLTEQDIAHLPALVQHYLRFTGSVGKPKVVNFRLTAQGEMKQKIDSEWFGIEAKQYSFFDDPTRLFYISSTMYGIPFDGYHAYIADSATMQITLGHLLEVADARGAVMNKSETVTMFNDMVLLAPATLISPAIVWEEIDSVSVKGTFTNRGNTISATITFDPSGAVKNFVSHDRSYSIDGKTSFNYPWSTPVTEYKEFEGRKAILYGVAIWHTPQGNHEYARFRTMELQYNVGQ
jgi:hypothetical protein